MRTVLSNGIPCKEGASGSGGGGGGEGVSAGAPTVEVRGAVRGEQAQAKLRRTIKNSWILCMANGFDIQIPKNYWNFAFAN